MWRSQIETGDKTERWGVVRRTRRRVAALAGPLRTLLSFITCSEFVQPSRIRRPNPPALATVPTVKFLARQKFVSAEGARSRRLRHGSIRR